MKVIQLALVLNHPKHRQEMVDWAKERNLTVKNQNDYYIDVEASSEVLGKVFEVDIHVHDSGDWQADAEPVKPNGLHAVVGLDSMPKVHRAVKIQEQTSPKGFMPKDIREAYQIPGTYTGEGETIGLLEFDSGYSQDSIDGFAKQTGLEIAQKPIVVPVDGGKNDGGTSKIDMEATLDVEWVYAIAPKVKLVVYEAPGGKTYSAFALHMLHALHAAMTDKDNVPSVLSISYGDAETSFPKDDLLGWEKLMSAAADQGVIVCVSSGDQGAYGLHSPYGNRIRHVDGPASCPGALAIGGTTLSMDRNQETSERAWTDTNQNGATGGGKSKTFQMPSYQKDANIQGTMRGIPDVSANADPLSGYYVNFNGKHSVIGGTSASCPVWAAILVGMNQQRKSEGLKPLDNIHSKIYSLQGKGFRDITNGNNSYNGVTGYEAKQGWDYCTGWGVPIVSELATLLNKAQK